MTFLAKTIIIAVASLAAATVYAAEVPTLDVSGTCKPIPGDRTFAIDTDKCFKTEREAREQLMRQWTNFAETDRTQCTQRATMAGMASYVALITCLEMKRDVAKLPADRGLTVRPAGLPQK